MAVITKVPMNSKVAAGQITFTSSQTWTVPRGVKKVDVFLVGGGGGRGYDWSSSNEGSETDPTVYHVRYSGGYGGSGYTATYLNVTTTPLSSINVVVGEGGTMATNGGSSSFGNLSVSGGNCGSSAGVLVAGSGGKGGSGGGGGAASTYEIYKGTNTVASSNYGTNGTGGINGSNGTIGKDGYGSEVSSGGQGQGTTTRAFGESSGALYAQGGGVSTPNTDNSGNGSASGNTSGCSGIVIVRWEAQ